MPDFLLLGLLINALEHAMPPTSATEMLGAVI